MVVDGDNSHWADSQRHAEFGAAGVRFLDIGTSGRGEGAARHCFMAGGEREALPANESDEAT
jgi:6-phosphogluconate dehydrogenase (decarboxylating)